MARITKQQFTSTLSQGLNPRDPETARVLRQAGVDASRVPPQADGRVRLPGAELDRLFAYVDSVDRNGDAGSFDTTGPAGPLYDALLRPIAPPTTPTVGRLSAADFRAISQGAVAFMQQSKTGNDAAIARDGVGLFYGGKSGYAKMSEPQRLAFVQRALAAKDPARGRQPEEVKRLMERMAPTSCIGYALKVVEAGYIAAGKGARWQEVERIVRSEGSLGTTLARELEKDGWQAVYWTADRRGYQGPTPAAGSVSLTAVNDQRQVFDPRYVDASGQFKPARDAVTGQPLPRRDYYGVTPTHGLIDFAPKGRSPRTEVLAQLDAVPFFVGVASSGYHTIVGHGQELGDSHLMRGPDDPTNIERRPFHEITHEYDLAAKKDVIGADGHPELGIEQSGLIMVPPGTFGLAQS